MLIDFFSCELLFATALVFVCWCMADGLNGQLIGFSRRSVRPVNGNYSTQIMLCCNATQYLLQQLNELKNQRFSIKILPDGIVWREFGRDRCLDSSYLENICNHS